MSFDTALNEQGWPPHIAASSRRSHRRKGLPGAFLTILLLLSLTTIVGAQDGANAPLPTGVDNKAAAPSPPSSSDQNATAPASGPSGGNDTGPAAGGSSNDTNGTAAEPPKNEPPKEEPKTDGAPAEEGADDQFLKNGKPRIRIESISPAHGPTTGDTKVTVRGGPFAQFQQEHPEPKCKFGDQTVGAAYVPCPPRQPKAYEKEGGRAVRTALCI